MSSKARVGWPVGALPRVLPHALPRVVLHALPRVVQRALLRALGCTILLAAAAGPARADSVAIPAGSTYTLTGDITLASAETFMAGDAAGAACTIHGGGHSILSADGWTGSFTLRNCAVDGLGTPDVAAVLLHATGTTAVAIEQTDFATSGLLRFALDDQSSFSFRSNVIEESAVIPTVKAFDGSSPWLMATGTSTGSKVIQGNKAYRSRLRLSTTSGWTIEGNVLLGTRAGIELEDASNVTIRGNYSHTLVEGTEWNQVKNIAVIGGTGLVVEHNVFWGRQWVAQINGAGEFRYNLLMDSIERGWFEVYRLAGIIIHHNLLIQTKDSPQVQAPGVVVVADSTTGPTTTEFFNNTFDAGDKCNPAIPGAVQFNGAGALKSLRSNAFLGVRVMPEPGAALVRVLDTDYPAGASLPGTMPVHMDYADYNLFFNPDSPVKVNYGVGVEGKAERQDPGFAASDALPGGAVDQQVDPKLNVSQIPRSFPFSEDDIKSGSTTVCQILAYYRQVYAPLAGSPLLGGGDPADGTGTDIGAVGDGADAADQFGRLCANATDIGHPAPDLTSCKEVPLQIGSTGQGGAGGTTPPAGFACVCTAGATPAASVWSSCFFASVALITLTSRRRSRRRRAHPTAVG